MRQLKVGSTNPSIDLFVLDSSVTTGQGLAGLTFNTVGLKAYYRNGYNGAATSIALATLTGPTAAWSSGGFVEIDAVNMKGVYRLDLPNAAVASGTCISLLLFGATNMTPAYVELELVAYDPYATPPAIQDFVNGVLDEAIAGHLAAGTVGTKINTSGSAADPLANPVSNYGIAGTVGKLIGDQLNATVGSRLAAASYTAPDNTSI